MPSGPPTLPAATCSASHSVVTSRSGWVYAEIFVSSALMAPSCHASRPRSHVVEAPEVLAAAPLELAELGDGVLHVPQALLEIRAPLVDLPEDVLELRAPPPRSVEEVDDRADFLQGEAQPLAPEDERQPGPVA